MSDGNKDERDADCECGMCDKPWTQNDNWMRDENGDFVDQSAKAELERLKDSIWGPMELSAEERSFAERAQRVALGYAVSARAIAALHLAEEHTRKALDALADGFHGPALEGDGPTRHRGIDSDVFESVEQKEHTYQDIRDAFSSLDKAHQDISMAMRTVTGKIRYRIDGLKDVEAISEAADEAIFLRMCAERGLDKKRRTDFLLARYGFAAVRSKLSYEERQAHRGKARKAVAEDEDRFQKYSPNLGDWGRDNMEMMQSERGEFPAWFVARSRGDLLAFQRLFGLAPRRTNGEPLAPITAAEAEELDVKWQTLIGALRRAITTTGKRAIMDPYSVPGEPSPALLTFRAVLLDIGRELLGNPITNHLGSAYVLCDVAAIEREDDRLEELRRFNSATPFLDPDILESANKLLQQAKTRLEEYLSTISPEDRELVASWRKAEKPALTLLRGGEVDDES